MDRLQQTEIEAAAFRRLTAHLQKKVTVQNIDLMILADFCRNCLAKWLAESATEQHIDFDYEQARQYVYGMPYSEWKAKYQQKATTAQLAAYEKRQR